MNLYCIFRYQILNTYTETGNGSLKAAISVTCGGQIILTYAHLFLRDFTINLVLSDIYAEASAESFKAALISGCNSVELPVAVILVDLTYNESCLN